MGVGEGEGEEAVETGEEESRPSSRERRPSLRVMRRQMKVRGNFFCDQFQIQGLSPIKNTSVQFYFYTVEFL